MLVISRKPNESVDIGETRLTVLEAKSGRVQLGIEAPATVPIARSELQATIPTRVPSEHAMFASKLMYSLRVLLTQSRSEYSLGDKWKNLIGVPVDVLEQAEEVCKQYEAFLYDEE